jgi:hypothetical protein
MKTLCFISFLLICNVVHTQTLIGNSILGANIDDDTGSAVAISKDGKIVAVGTPKIKNAEGKDIGETRVYALVNGVWTQLGNTIPGVEPTTNSGGKLDLDDEGKRLVLGALFNNNGGSGVVRVFEWKNNQWVQMGSGFGTTNFFVNVGYSVKISGNGKRVVFNTDIVTSTSELSGTVQIFEWNGTSWNKIGYTLTSISKADGFGLAVAINYEGDQIIVGAPYASNGGVNGGEAKVYTFENGQWKQKGQILKGKAVGGFGEDVDITGTGSRIIIGSNQKVNNMTFAGGVRVYDYEGSEWKQLGDTILGTMPFQRLGQQVEISADGNIISFGNSGVNGATGQIKTYKLVNQNWKPIGNPIIGIDSFDRLGYDSKLSSDGKTIIVGAVVNSNIETKPGYAQVWAIDQDEDNDGFNSKLDCNDNNPLIHPNAIEICDNIDNNCNGLTDDGLQNFTYYIDKDGDGYGISANALTTCQANAPSGYSTKDLDCDDTKASINPASTEVCDSVDNNCNGTTDDGLQTFIYYLDNDGDGYGITTNALTTCNANTPSGYANKDLDCDDGNEAVNPTVAEVCDNIDNNCNGMTDDGLQTFTYFIDNDGDGYGITTNALTTCNANTPSGYANQDLDCDDGNPAINPTATEVCDNIDNNCNSLSDDGLQTFTYYTDADGDGFGISTNTLTSCQTSVPLGYANKDLDCDDSNVLINPLATEIPNNGIDEDCNGVDLVTSTNDINVEQFILYPNPVYSILNIKNTKNANFTIILRSLTSKNVMFYQNPTSIDLSSLENGIYILQFIFDEGQKSQFQKIIIQH